MRENVFRNPVFDSNTSIHQYLYLTHLLLFISYTFSYRETDDMVDNVNNYFSPVAGLCDYNS